VRGGSLVASLALALAMVAPAAAEPPRRVVSMNLCTDQLAMLLAAPGQLVSVSRIASDVRTSAMAEEAAAYPANSGQAEDIYLLAPDLVVAGSFSDSATVGMLRRLGVPVVQLSPAASMEGVARAITEMGAVLGRESEAARMRAAFEARLAALRDEVEARPRAALYYANGYTLGDGTLAGEILLAAGLSNVAAELGLPGGGTLPLEVLALAEVDALVTGQPYPGASRSEEILEHPVLDAIREGRAAGAVSTGDWVCGTPHVLRAVEAMRVLRDEAG
jgi:iron complex transport system substrate-binding protein